MSRENLGKTYYEQRDDIIEEITKENKVLHTKIKLLTKENKGLKEIRDKFSIDLGDMIKRSDKIKEISK